MRVAIKIRASRKSSGERFSAYSVSDRRIDSGHRMRPIRHDDDDTPPRIDPPKPAAPNGVRDFVPVDPVRTVDPPKRIHFINSLPPHKRATALIRGYVEGLIESNGEPRTPKGVASKKAEKLAARGFLRAWHDIEADGNEMGIDLAVIPAKGNAVQFFFHIHGLGPVVWLPVLVTESNNHTHHIMRESGPNRIDIAPGPRAPFDPDDETRRRVPTKIETVLIR
jgi:hypothetical protein